MADLPVAAPEDDADALPFERAADYEERRMRVLLGRARAAQRSRLRGRGHATPR